MHTPVPRRWGAACARWACSRRARASIGIVAVVAAIAATWSTWSGQRAALLKAHPIISVQAPLATPVGAAIELLVQARDSEGRPLALTLDADCHRGYHRTTIARPVLALGPIATGADGLARLRVPATIGLAGEELRIDVWNADAKAPQKVRTKVRRTRDGLLARVGTDKPLYRPGDVVRARVLVLERFRLAPAEGAAATLELLKPDGSVLGAGAVELTDGVGEWEHRLEPALAGGDYLLRCTGDFPTLERRISVRRFRAPRLRSRIQLDHAAYAPGATGRATLETVRAEGGIPIGAALEAVLVVDGTPAVTRTARLPDSGRWEFTFRVPEQVAEGRGLVRITVSDGGTVETATRPVPINVGRRDVAFYPEGGDLVAGLPTRVYFAARDAGGAPAHLVADLVDRRGDVVARLTTGAIGMGRFELTPRLGAKYRIVSRTPVDASIRGELPRVLAGGVALRTLQARVGGGDPIAVAVTTSRSGAYSIVAVIRGASVGQARVRLERGQTRRIELPQSERVGGVARITVSDRAGRPRAERLVAVDPADRVTVDIRTRPAQCTPGQTVDVVLTARDEAGRPVAAVLGVAVTDEAMHAAADDRDTPSLAMHFLLGLEVDELRDVRRFAGGPDAERNTDLLLGVQGWRRFALHDAEAVLAADPVRAPLILAGGTDSTPTLRSNRRRARAAMGAMVEQLDETYARAIGFVLILVAMLALYWLLAHRPSWLTSPWPMAIVATSVCITIVVGAVAVAEIRAIFGLCLAAAAGAGIVAWLQRVPRRHAVGVALLALVLGTTPAVLVMNAAMSNVDRPAGVRMSVALAMEQWDDPFEEELQEEEDSLDRDIKTDEPAIEDPVIKDAEESDHNETDNNEEYEQSQGEEDAVSDKPFQGKYWNDAIGIGGGAAGKWGHRAFGGRFGGRRDIPRVAAAPLRDAAVWVREGALRPFSAEPTLRRNFADVLLWSPRLVTTVDGRARIAFQASDAVTAFRITVEAHDGRGALATARATVDSRLRFFIAPKLPPEIGGGDRLDLPVVVANATGGPIETRVALELKGEACRAAGPTIQELTLPTGARVRTRFPLVARNRFGTMALTFSALAGEDTTDAVRRTLAVRPRGFPRSLARNTVVVGRAELTVELPATFERDTLEGSLRCYPMPVAEVLDGVEGVLRTPSGCFEQASASNYPNVMALLFLEQTNQVLPAIRKRAENVLASGYELLRGYQCPSGGFDWYGRDPAHAGLTAYGVLEFTDMAKVWKVDPTIVQRATTWLLSRRDGTGSFTRDSGGYWNGQLQSTRDAYICWALAEAGLSGQIARELRHLGERTLAEKDPYVIALSALALRHTNPAATTDLCRRLASAQEEDGRIVGARSSLTQSAGHNLEIETTALAACAFLTRPAYRRAARRAIDWIRNQRRANGMFGSTQATVLALRALLAQARAGIVSADGHGEVVVSVNGREVARSRPGTETTLVIFEAPLLAALRPGTNTVTVTAPKEWNLPSSIGLTWFADTPAKTAPARVSIQTTLALAAAREGQTVGCTVTVRNTTSSEAPSPIARIGIPAGLVPSVAQLRELVAKASIAHFEIRPREITFYWRRLAAGQTRSCGLDLVAHHPGRFTGPASRAYLYYDDGATSWADPMQITISAAR